MNKKQVILSQEIDEAMKKEDYSTAVERARELLMMSIDEIGMETFARASVIFAYAQIKTGKHDDAKKVLNSLINGKIGLYDSHYLLFCIAYEERKIDEIIDHGKKFIDLIINADETPVSVTTAVNNAHELFNNLGTILLENGKMEESITVFNGGIKYKDDYALLYVNAGVAYHQNGQYDKAEKILISGLEKCGDNSDLHRTLGLIYDENYYFLKAEIHLRKALELGDIEPHLDLAIMYNKLFKIYDAEEEIRQYLRYVPDDPNALKLLNSIHALEYYGNPEEKISAAMIVKNEEGMLAECIESFREAVDEIVIVDTGSSDKTVEIAESYNVKLFHHEWKNDFSEARNFSISKTTGDWILIIDADERLEREDIPLIRALKWDKDQNIISFAVYSSLPGNLGNANFGKHFSPRLFRKKPEFYYYGIVHNVLNITENVAVTNIRLYHLGYDLDQDKMKKKFERSIKLLLKQVEEHPDDAFIRMNTAQMYLSRNHSDEAEEHALKCIEILEADPGHQEHLYLMALYQVSLIHLRRMEYEKCIEFAQKAVNRKEDYIDPMLNLGWCYYSSKEYDKSVEILNKFLEYREDLVKNEGAGLLILSKLGSDYEANFLLGEIHKENGEFEQAVGYYNKALESNSFFWNVYNSLGEIQMKEEKFAEAADSFENAVKYGYLNLEKYGTFGSQEDVYKQALKNYQEAVKKDVEAQKKKPSVTDALGNIDALLNAATKE